VKEARGGQNCKDAKLKAWKNLVLCGEVKVWAFELVDYCGSHVGSSTLDEKS
jgi:hypothetical protein